MDAREVIADSLRQEPRDISYMTSADLILTALREAGYAVEREADVTALKQQLADALNLLVEYGELMPTLSSRPFPPAYYEQLAVAKTAAAQASAIFKGE